MKSLKTLVCATSFALCVGAASMASAATIAPTGGFTASGPISVASPASLGIAVPCNITFTGTVAANGTTAAITGASVSGSNALCGVPVMQNLPWTLKNIVPVAGSTNNFTGVVEGVSFKIVSNCGTANIAVTWNNATNTLSIPAAQTVGACSIKTLAVNPSPAFTVTP